MIFEKKDLVAQLLLSEPHFHVLLRGDDEIGEAHHPRYDELFDARAKTLERIVDSIAGYTGDRIDFYCIAPGHGNIDAIVDALKEREKSGQPAWPKKASWRVYLYSGAFNMRGMF